MMKKTSKATYFIAVFTLLMTANFYFSNLIVSKLSHGWAFSNKFINLLYVKNTGAAFSIMQNSTLFLIILSVIALSLIIYYILKNIEILSAKELFCVAFLVSGITGNLYERIAFGYVRDFFELAFINFPVFNISDMFINVGVFAIILLILFTKKTIKLI